MIITPASITSLFRGFRKDFQDGQGMAKPYYGRIATTIPSTTRSNTYGWLGQWPQFREWIGSRVIRDMKAHGYELTNKSWESSVGVSRPDIEDDNIGIYSPMFQEMGRGEAAFPDELITQLVLGGEGGLCYDGQPFFDEEHPVFANVDGTGTETAVSNLLEPETNAGEGWYLLDCSRALKPFIYQLRKKAEFTAMTKPDDEGVFMDNEFRFGADLRAEAGYGFWQMAVKSTHPLTRENFIAAREHMRKFKADGGRPLGVKPTILLCSPALEAAAEDILIADRNAAGATNTQKGKCELISTEWLSQ